MSEPVRKDTAWPMQSFFSAAGSASRGRYAQCVILPEAGCVFEGSGLWSKRVV